MFLFINYEDLRKSTIPSTDCIQIVSLSDSEAKILQDGLAKMRADIKKRDSVIAELARILEEGKKTTVELIMEIDMLRRRPTIYENAHSLPSHGSVPAQQKKTRSAKGPNRQNRSKERRL